MVAAAVPLVISAARIVTVAVLVVQVARRVLAAMIAVIAVPRGQFAPRAAPARIPAIVIAKAVVTTDPGSSRASVPAALAQRCGKQRAAALLQCFTTIARLAGRPVRINPALAIIHLHEIASVKRETGIRIAHQVGRALLRREEVLQHAVACWFHDQHFASAADPGPAIDPVTIEREIGRRVAQSLRIAIGLINPVIGDRADRRRGILRRHWRWWRRGGHRHHWQQRRGRYPDQHRLHRGELDRLAPGNLAALGPGGGAQLRGCDGLARGGIALGLPGGCRVRLTQRSKRAR